jgi:methylase of polypeptide subunit release factors
MKITKDNLKMCNELLQKKEVKYHEFGGIKVFYTPDTYAGGAKFGQDYIRFITENKLKPKRVFEWCTGAGFIGFSLLAHGLCKTLCLSDINMEAVACCLKTIHENKLYASVTLYHSDNLDSIPKSEKWDLIVGNPPHFYEKRKLRASKLLYLDKDWNLHQRFYSKIDNFLSHDGLILLQENSQGSSCKTFREMIKKNGFRIIHTSFIPDTTIYYIGCIKKK